MKRTEHFVFDTNVIISAMILPHGKSRLALDRALDKGDVVVSEETLLELSDKILAAKFDKYIPLSERMLFLQWFKKSSKLVNVSEQIVLSRDPDDDKFLSLAVTANVDAIISGDKDLLVLNPFKNILIL
ncbi:MAG: putative toxin-antitoxin system toxin component, PIN family [Cytophagales bacterium]|nr:putative toxin-antitoxin system toxin component, PIN family [Cytophagales bacterium]